MKLPGGESTVRACSEHSFDYWQRIVSRRNGSLPEMFDDQPDDFQAEWDELQRQIGAIITVAIIRDMLETVDTYDGLIGATIRRAIFRYARQELDYDLSETEMESGDSDGTLDHAEQAAGDKPGSRFDYIDTVQRVEGLAGCKSGAGRKPVRNGHGGVAE